MKIESLLVQRQIQRTKITDVGEDEDGKESSSSHPLLTELKCV